MARKKGRPPKSPSSQTSSRSPSNAIPKNLDLENLDEDDLEDIDALSPTKAASILQKLDALRAKIKGKAVVDDNDGNMNASQADKNITSERRMDLWKELQEIGDSMQDKWVIMGDFNCCLNVQEKAGGIPLDVQKTVDFREMSLWRFDGEGCAMFRLMRNLERAKPGMIELNQRKYRDIDQKEILARDKLDVIQGLLQADPMNNHLQKLEREARRDHYEEANEDC
ncbi:hypothetical protein RIF29_14673 [Crotalaria pallida]|uniref:Uncharacterized protein n=1 Tax=Crotalaria pallida TaxID=3830 RepID=A0AAN9FFS3_CROPI